MSNSHKYLTGDNPVVASPGCGTAGLGIAMPEMGDIWKGSNGGINILACIGNSLKLSQQLSYRNTCSTLDCLIVQG